MKTSSIAKSALAIGLFALALPTASFAQEEEGKKDEGAISYGEPDFFRSYDKRGLNVFETSKEDLNKEYTGRRISFGAGFALQFQSLKHENPGALANPGGATNATANRNMLVPVAPGFSLPQANLYIDAQLAEGIRLHLGNYMAAKHHNEFWVKGGYLQVDKMPFKGEFWDKLSEVVTVKAGHMEINYGDAHFRRPDGGHVSYSPFMEGNIMDAFATEIAAEVYAQKNGWLAMVAASNGMIQGHTRDVPPTANGLDKRNPSLYAKLGYDKQLNESVRVRLTGSVYHNGGSNGTRLTLFEGDRTGSNYNFVMEPNFDGTGAARGNSAIFKAGRFDAGYGGKLTTFAINPFLKAQGFEFFGTAEFAKGKGTTAIDHTNRATSQYAAEGIYRFGTKEDLFFGAKYNIVNSELLYGTDAASRAVRDVKIDRFAVGAGWFITNTILVKAEYVTQSYKDFPNTDYRHNGKFNGLVLQAGISF